jgi:predicted MFS family arabinose efflux permease
VSGVSGGGDTGSVRSGMTRGLIVLFAIATGQAVASNYLAQPLLETLRHQFGVSSTVAGLIITVSQIGYATGLVLLLPLGDLLERRRLITTLAAITAVGLAAAALAPSIGFFAAAIGLVGFTSVMAQILIPIAAGLALDDERGRVIGTIMSGLIIGVLLARTVSGAVAALAGWRTVYWVAAVLMVVLAAVLHHALPRSRARIRLTYPRLLLSVLTIAREEPRLRRQAVHGVLSFAAFSGFWTTLTFLLAGPHYGYSTGAIGLFGLIGVAGATTASVVGRFTDRGWSLRLTGVTSMLIASGYVLLWAGGTSLAALIAGVLVLDIGCQGLHITSQSEIYRLRPEARSRVNAFYMTSRFVGGGAGSAAAAVAFGMFGWPGVCLLGMGFGLASTLWWATGLRSRTGARRDPTPGDEAGASLAIAAALSESESFDAEQPAHERAAADHTGAPTAPHAHVTEAFPQSSAQTAPHHPS